jgi:SAM-dependent methyltransferase
MEDVAVTAELEAALCDLLQTEEFFQPRVYEVLSLALALPAARILAIDITCRSLAYARMMAERYRVANVEFQRRDILALPSSGQQFDMVDCVGVIHHIRDPAAGLRALLTCLRPGGLLRLGVYSRSGRDAVVRFRARQPSSRPGPAALREIRHGIVAAGDHGPYADLLRFRDFCSLSGCRDLLLHEHECQFTIPELRTLLAAHGLTFLRLALQPGMIESLHDGAGSGTGAFDLQSWHQAELRTPSLFAGMYILFARFDGQA